MEVFGLSAETVREVLAAFGPVNAVGEAFTVFKLSGLEGLAGRGGRLAAAARLQGGARAPRHRRGGRSLAVAGGGLAPPRLHHQRPPLRPRPRRAPRSPPRGARPRGARPARGGREPLRRGPAARAARGPARGALRARPSIPRPRRCAGRCRCASCPPSVSSGEIEKLLLEARRPSHRPAPDEGVGDAARARPRAGAAGRHAAGSGVAPGGRRLDAHPAGRRPGRAAARGAGPAARAGGDAGHAGPRPRASRGRRRRSTGRIRSHGHEEAGVPLAESLLERWGVHTLHGYDVRGQVLGLVGNHLKPGQLYDDRERVSDGAIRRLAASASPRCCIAWRARIASAAPGISRPWRWSGSWSGCRSSRWRSARRSRS